MMIGDFLSRFDSKTTTGDQWLVMCPGHDDRRASFAMREGDDRRILLNCHAGCSRQHILSAMGLTDADLFSQSKPDSRREVGIYAYRDEQGKLLYQVVRFDPKDFRQRRPDGSGGYIWNLKDTRRVLYRLPELKGKEAVVVC